MEEDDSDEEVNKILSSKRKSQKNVKTFKENMDSSGDDAVSDTSLEYI